MSWPPKVRKMIFDWPLIKTPKKKRYIQTKKRLRYTQVDCCQAWCHLWLFPSFNSSSYTPTPVNSFPYFVRARFLIFFLSNYWLGICIGRKDSSNQFSMSHMRPRFSEPSAQNRASRWLSLSFTLSHFFCLSPLTFCLSISFPSLSHSLSLFPCYLSI